MRAGLNCRVTPPELRGVHRWQRRGREGRPRAGGKLPSPTAGGTPRASGGSTVGGGEVARAGLALAGNSQVPRPGSTPRASGGPPLAAAMGARAGLALAEPQVPRPGSTPELRGPPR